MDNSSLRSPTGLPISKLYESEYKNIIFAINELVNNMAVAEELAQDTFIKAIEHQDEFEGKSQPKTWLNSIAVNEAKMYLRSENAKVQRDNDYAEFNEPVDTIAQEEAKMDMMTLIAELPIKQRQCVEMRLEGYTYDDIAHTLSIPIGTVMSRLSVAKESMVTDA